VCVAGPNGSGKSTLKRGLGRLGSLGNWIDPDVVAKDFKSRTPQHVSQQEVEAKAFAIARSMRIDYAAALSDFGFETVFSHHSNVAFLEALKILGYEVILYFVCTGDSSINVGRVKNRVALGGHDVPHDKIVSRYARSLLYCCHSVRLVDKVVLFDNSQQTTSGKAVAEIIGDPTNTITIQSSPHVPKWVLEVLEKGFSPQPLGGFLGSSWKTAKTSNIQERRLLLRQFEIGS
jgi:predicted ABC-type ATPase